ncbi:LytR family transcriptional regulator [Solihabitans fulvus]|uniref:LytR family transcriptional regulator n=1 Tax=Solihabitans fulvus TaxID=1892852 RepID=A0A5B2XCV6_9PSEU|nr:LCP family protein [Solihabitans fulvus]KAA2261163.1 LytR family transcriptional regulator [Solihabitans fulvus]
MNRSVAPGAGYQPGPAGARPAPRRRKRRTGKIILAVLVVLLLLVVGGWIYLDANLKRVSALNDYPGRPAETPGTTWLMVGSDARDDLTEEQKKQLSTGDAAGARTDTIMLLHIPSGSGKAELISVPRDSYVAIPGNGKNKVNAAFAFGGPTLLVQTVEQATGLRVDHYAEIGFGGFAGVVDAIGGVNMCLDQPMQDDKAGIDLKAGCQDLDGAQALGFVRSRNFARSDFQRVENQRKFLSALMDKATSFSVLANPFRAIPLVFKGTGTITVADGDHLHNLAGLAFALGGGVATATVPVGGTPTLNVGSVVVWDDAKAKRMFDAIRQDQPIPAELLQQGG